MDNSFPKAHDAEIQLLNDRHDALYASNAQLSAKIVGITGEGTKGVMSLMSEIIASRPKSDSTALEQLEYQYKGLRLMTLLGLSNPNGVFVATVPYDSELEEKLRNEGDWCVCNTENEKTMEVSTLPF